MRGLHRLILACTVVAAFATNAHAQTSITFQTGSLILPTSSSFQDDCGAISVYGLVYDVLRGNTWLAANGYHAITINYAYNSAKNSPNRCTPTSADGSTDRYTNTSSSFPACTGTCLTDPSWNDGCDFTIPTSGTSAQPVLLEKFATASVTTASVTTYDTHAKTTVSPGYKSQVVSASVTSVGYLGGPFIIAKGSGASDDVALFTQLLEGSVIAYDTNGDAIDFSPFRTFNSSGNQKAAPTSQCTLGTDHYVNIHQAQTSFSASIGKQFTSTPPRIALVNHDTGHISGTGSDPSGVVSGILSVYLSDAGLNFSTAGGCPTGGKNSSNSSICPTGTAKQGQIYDDFDLADVQNSSLASKTYLFAQNSSGVPLYAMLWTPHWATTANGPSATEKTIFSNIQTFLSGAGGASGLMAECASISSFEGMNYSLLGTGPNNAGLHLQTCTNSSGSCATGSASYGITNLSSDVNTSSNGYFVNCSDVSVKTGTECTYYANPGDPYQQTGDYVWDMQGGWVAAFTPTSGQIYQPGVTTLVSHVPSLKSRSDLTSLATMRGASEIDYDVSNRNIYNNTSGGGNILYMSGHNDSGDVASTKMILLTLLQLGFTTVVPPQSTTEVSRATPIEATVGTQDALVQGTFDEVTPAGTAKTVNAPADIASFQFPFIVGHMRARTTASVTTTASTFSSGTVLFDAATVIPPVTNSGCGTNAFTGSCRTVFTNSPTATPVTGTGTTRNPALVYLNDSTASSLGSAMGLPSTSFSTANQQAFVERILAGVPNGTGGYAPQLGGVDRSTVAVIPASTVAGSARPTMVYFGATDGMMHAVCASVNATQGCDILGRELWAFLPRVQLPFLRLNTQRIDGSPRVMDFFGDPLGSGVNAFHTMLFFQTGSGNAKVSGSTPAIYALDVTNPQTPTVVWEYTLATAPSTNVLDLGQGEALGAGTVSANGTITPMVYAQTNNGGTGTAGLVTDGINAMTGAQTWRFSYTYPAVRKAGDAAVPTTGIPGGAVAFDKQGSGFITDVVFGDLYGNAWLLDAVAGASRFLNGGTPVALFSFTTDYHPIGSLPAIYSNGGFLYGIVSSGGYADLSDTTWVGSPAATQYAVPIRLVPTVTPPPSLNETSGKPNVPFTITFGSGESGYSQVVVVGNELFITTDSTDVNSTSYGSSTANTGHVYNYTFGGSSPSQGSTVVVASGASSVAADTSTNTVYSSSSASQQQVNTPVTAAGGTSVNDQFTTQASRQLWLRTQ